MARTITVGNYPHTKVLKDGEVKIEGVDVEFVEVEPINKSFARMARTLEFDVCEMAIATYLMAYDNDIPITLFPMVLVGNFHHRSLVSWPGKNVKPEDLVGNKVGVRAYSQTTGLWVRGILKEEYGIASDSMTWVTTEEAHVQQWKEPDFIVRTDEKLTDLLESGEIIAGVLKQNALAAKGGPELDLVFPDVDAKIKAWYDLHGTIPINHMCTVQTEFLKEDPKAVKAIYQGFKRAIEETASLRGDAPKDKAVKIGIDDEMLKAIDIAIEYSLEQKLIYKKVTAEELFKDAHLYMD